MPSSDPAWRLPLPSEASSPALYANFFRVGHNEAELLIELCQSYRDEKDAQATAVVTRIFVTPDGARELHRLLGATLDKQTRLRARGAQARAR